MEPVLEISQPGYVGDTPVSDKPSGKDGFSDHILLAKAGELLRTTSQHERWTALRQNNGALALKTAKIILTRHGLLEKARKGEKIDWTQVDRLTRDLKEAGIALYNSNQLSKAPQTIPGTPKTVSPLIGPVEKTLLKGPVRDTLSEENLVILNVEYKNYILNNSLIGYGNAESVHLPLSAISQTLDFMIDTDTGTGKSSGWFISEDRQFSLDMQTGQVMADGRQFKFSDTDVIALDGDFYVDAKLLSQWFPVNFNYRFSEQSLGIEPREKIPFQKRMEREMVGQDLKSRGLDEAILPRKKSKYDLFSLPFIDLGVSGRYSGGTENDDGLTSGFYINAKGDLGKMNTEFYLSGSGEDGLEESRITLLREDPDGGILGPLDATSVSAGDIRVAKVPVLGGGQSERGIRISNEDLIRSKEFDTTFFQGNMPPGWDVEVYRNNSLVATQRVGQDGRYTFDDIPVYYGKNEFRLKFYGPQGQEKEEVKQINVGGELIKKGEGEYRLSISQNDTDIYDPNKTTSDKDDETLNFNAYYSYGIIPGFSMNAGVASHEVEGERHNYLNLGTKGVLNGMYLSGDVVRDTQGGDAVELFAQKGFNGMDLRIKQQFFNGFITDDSDITNPRKRETDISVSSRIPESDYLPTIPFTLGYDETKRDSYTEQNWSLRTSSKIKGVNLNNRIDWRKKPSESNTDAELSAQIQAVTYLRKLRLRGFAEYDIHPDTELTKTELSAFYAIDKDLSTELSLTKDLTEKKDLESALQLNWNNGVVNISPRVSYNRNGEWDARLSVSTSFGREPRTGKIKASSTQLADSGSVSAKVFHDTNQNLVFDGEDKVIKGAVVKAVQSHKEMAADNEGVAFLTGLQKNKPTDIILDTDSLTDPFWAPVKKSKSIVPRPGHVEKIDIPVVTTGEIDGTLVTHTADGMEEPLSNIKIQLLNRQGNIVQEVRSEYDGYYYFQKVFPGRYSVRVAPENTQKLNANAPAFEVEIDDKGTVASGNTIILKKNTSLAQGGSSTDEAGPLVKKTETRDGFVEPPKALETAGQKEAPAQSFVESTAAPSPPTAADRATWADSAPISSTSLQRYGLHLTSYRTPEKAAKGISALIKKYGATLRQSDFSIKKVTLSEGKGTWYRVIAGTFSTKENALQFKEKLNRPVPYAKVITLGSPENTDHFKGVHLASYRNRPQAEKGINELKNQYPNLLKSQPFTIRMVDLGPKMGVWNRVVAGKFSKASQAVQLAQKLKVGQPYCKVTTVEKQDEFSVHLASYRTPEAASAGIGELQEKMSSQLEGKSLFIRRTDLGKKKGVWYRIFAGDFKNKTVAAEFKTQLQQKNQYARILRL
jgi:hypothetical protein